MMIARGSIIVLLLLLAACTTALQPVSQSKPPQVQPQDPVGDLLETQEVIVSNPPVTVPEAQKSLKKLGFAVQVGAFSRMDNAVGLENLLRRRGVDAYHFLHESGFYKVRFGDHDNYTAARSEAERLERQGIIDSFFIVLPDSYVAVNVPEGKPQPVRAVLVKTAKRFLGVPYRWGGEDRHNGFDCSGLTMVSYRLNGLKLPRNSRMQYRAGKGIKKSQLKQGDLVFFATKGGTRVTHVGMYVGSGQFIHAPRPGKTVRIANLDSKYFRRTYVGARTYL